MTPLHSKIWNQVGVTARWGEFGKQKNTWNMWRVNSVTTLHGSALIYQSLNAPSSLAMPPFFPPQPWNYSTALPKELCDVNEGLKQTSRQSTGVACGTIWPQVCIESQMSPLHTLRLASTLHQQKSTQTQIKIKRGVKPVAAPVYSGVTSHRVFPCGCLLHPNAPSSRMHTWQESHRPECRGRLEIKCSKNDSSEGCPGLIGKGGWLRWFWIFHGFKLQLHAWHGYSSPLIIH